MPFRKKQVFTPSSVGVVCSDPLYHESDDGSLIVEHPNPYICKRVGTEGDLKRLIRSGANIREVNPLILEAVGIGNMEGNDDEEYTEN